MKLFKLIPILLCALPMVGRAAEPTLSEGEAKFSALVGHDCPVIRLWPDGKVPDEPHGFQKSEFVTTEGKKGSVLRIQNVTEPSMVIISPPKEKNTGIAIVLAPGGGYGSLGSNLVKEVADWFGPRGITCVLLKYRVPKRRPYEMNFQPMQDAQRAMSILRGRAAEFGINPDKIGFGGFSAGGNLAACLLLNNKERWYKPVDEYDKLSFRPDFSILLYPAYLTKPITSRELDPKMGYTHLDPKATPPVFIAITFPDKFTFGSMEMYLALQKSGVPAELHIYPEGGHGGGIIQYPFGEWAKECDRFFAQQKIFPVMDEPASPVLPTGGGEKIPLAGTDATVSVLPPSGTSNHKAVIICPASKEPSAIAQASRIGAWLGTIGMTTVILEPGKADGDALEKNLAAALALARSKAGEWKINAQQVGICGIGSGARVAALAAAAAKKATGPLNPAFVILLSPSGLADPAHPGQADPALIDLRRTITPPIFLASTWENPALREMADYYLAIQPKRVFAECHVYHDSKEGGIVPADLATGITRWVKDLDHKDDPKAEPDNEKGPAGSEE